MGDTISRQVGLGSLQKQSEKELGAKLERSILHDFRFTCLSSYPDFPNNGL